MAECWEVRVCVCVCLGVCVYLPIWVCTGLCCYRIESARLCAHVHVLVSGYGGSPGKRAD